MIQPKIALSKLKYETQDRLPLVWEAVLGLFLGGVVDFL